jgi:SHS2 domain-containing protein
MPYRYLEEIATADVAFAAWGETREELFAACAVALLATMVDDPARVGHRQELTISLAAEELDLLLFAFLQELLFYKDARRLLLHAVSLRIEEEAGGYRLTAVVAGEEIAPRRHRLLVDVKAVTLYRFQVLWADGVWQATVVLDV